MTPLKAALVQGISTHAPRTGSDRIFGATFGAINNFNPRSPHGERPIRQQRTSRTETFQPTLPARGATGLLLRLLQFRPNFNPRSPHGERRSPTCYSTGHHPHFNPRSPHGERRIALLRHFPPQIHFNPRSPHGERQRKVTILSIRIIGFAQKVYHKTVLLRISLAENAVILPEKPRNPVRTSLQKAGGLRFARAIRAAHPYSISSPSGA